MKKLRLLVVSNMYPSAETPVYGIFVKKFVESMHHIGVEIRDTVVIPGSTQNLFKRALLYLRFIALSIYKIRNGGFDILYIHYAGQSLLPLLFCRFSPPPYLVINAHGSDVHPVSSIGQFIQWLVRPIVQRAQLIVVPSSYYRWELAKKFSVNRNKIYVSPSGGVDLSDFQEKTYEKEHSREFVIGYVSRIDEGKGWDILLKSVKLLSTKNTRSFQVLIIGSGKQVPQFESMINELNIRQYIQYIGAIPQHELNGYYHSMDVFVFPTYRKAESLGLVGLEAMACGVPVIGSKVGGLRSYIRPGYNGDFFTPKAVDELSIKLDQFMELDQCKIEELGKNARQTALQYDSLSVAKNLYQRLISLENTTNK